MALFFSHGWYQVWAFSVESRWSSPPGLCYHLSLHVYRCMSLRISHPLPCCTRSSSKTIHVSRQVEDEFVCVSIISRENRWRRFFFWYFFYGPAVRKSIEAESRQILPGRRFLRIAASQCKAQVLLLILDGEWLHVQLCGRRRTGEVGVCRALLCDSQSNSINQHSAIE